MAKSHPAIRVERLGKQYRIGRRERYLTLRDTLADAVRAPWRALRWGVQPPSVWALRDLSFEVEHGSVVGVIGANGAGKSTLLKILSRITSPTAGRAEVRGRIGSLLEVGTGFHPELTGRENVFLSGAMLGMKRVDIARKFDEIVDFSGVERFIDTPLKQYSSGMAVRLGFAVASQLETDILIVDEVLAVGDVVFQKKCLGRMAGVARDGRTVLFVSHDLAAVRSLTDTAICLDGGQIVSRGPTPEVLRDYVMRHVGVTSADGYVTLAGHPRREMLGNPDQVRFDWVRTKDQAGVQRGSFGEEQPIVVEFGFTVLEHVTNLEFGIGVASLQGVELFVVMSPIYPGPLSPGTHVLAMRIDPNYLKAGTYSMGLKIWANGARADTLHDAYRFNVVEAGVRRGPGGQYRRLGGHLHFDYAWDRIGRRPVGAT